MRFPADLRPDTREFYRDLWQMADELALESQERKWRISDTAAKSKLHPTTVRKLFSHETRFPHLLTIWKCAKALGYKLVLQKVAEVKKAQRKPRSKTKARPRIKVRKRKVA